MSFVFSRTVHEGDIVEGLRVLNDTLQDLVNSINRYSARKLRKNGITNLDFFIAYMVKGPTNMSSFTS